MRNAARDGSSGASRPRPFWVFGAAALLFAAVFLLRLTSGNPALAITLLYALPIALIAIELGVRWGLAAAAVALGLFAVWDVAWADDFDRNVVDYLTRGAAFFVLGGLVGSLADRLRRVSEESTRFWDLSTELLATAGFDGYFKRLNPAWERTLGWTLQELRSQPFIEFVHPDDRERTESEAASLTSAGYQTVNFENRYRCKDGGYRTILWSSTSVPEEGLIYAFARDVTQRKRAEEELRSSEQFLDSVLENLPNMVFVKDAEELRFVRLNRAGEELVGSPREELIGKNDHDLFPKQEADFFIQKDREVLASGEVVDIPEEPIETRENGSRILHTRKIAIRDEKGAPRYLLGISEDITDRKLAEQKFRDLLEAAPDAMVVADRNGTIVLVNAQTEKLLGYKRDELIGEPVEVLVPERFRDVHPGHRASYQSAPNARPMGAGLDLFARRKDGSELPVEISLSPVHTEGGTLVTAAIRDMTARKQIEQAAESARKEAERANHAKSEFLSRMSHELRTPLNAVIGFGQLLELDDLDSRQREGVEQILKAGRHLLELINEVLDISRIESGTMSMSLEPVHLGSVLAEALSLIRPLADQAEVRLTADPAECGDLYVHADQQRLKQVLINVLSNAVKYNRRGGDVRVRCDEPAQGQVEIAVADTGRGMTAEQLERLFAPFDRLGAERSDVEGTGLGLSLSIGLMEAMGGTITAESEPEAGSTIRVELKSVKGPEDEAAASNGAPARAEASARERRTIVYIEDNLSNLKLVERALDPLPEVRLIPAMQGKLGIDLARQHRPDLILLDLHLPDLHGRDVLERLKRDPATAAIPVVVLSADATPAQVERLRAAGAAGYLTKPIDVASLLNTVTGSLPESATR